MLVSIGSRNTEGEDFVGHLMACHERIRSFLRLAKAISTATDNSLHEVVDACLQAERYFKEALPLHVRDEEDSIAPRLKGFSPAVDEALDAMCAQHQTHHMPLGALLDALRSVREDPMGRDERAALFRAVQVVEEEFNAHLKLEEEVLFPALRLLPPPLQQQLTRELRSRRSKQAR